MGKSLYLQGSQSSPDLHNSGKMKGILRHFHHNPWHKVKKKLPHKKHDKENNKTTSEAAQTQRNSDSDVDNIVISGEIVKKTSPRYQVVTKGMELSRLTKSSMKSRLKSLITEEMYRKKSRHRRTTSCPENTDQDEPIPAGNRKSYDAESAAEDSSTDEVLKSNNRVNPVALLDPVLPKIGRNYLKQSEIQKIVRQPVRDHTLLKDESIFAIEPSKDASLQESKLFMDALDLLNVRKEMFLRIVQDQSSSLAQQMQTVRKSNLQSSLTKSSTFPMPGSSARQNHEQENSIDSQENGSSTKEEEDKLQQSEEDDKQSTLSRGSDVENGVPPQELKPLNNCSSPSSNMLRKMHNSKVSLNHFKKLRAKLKVVVRGKTPKKDHIVWDAVQHKVPYGQHIAPEETAEKLSKYAAGIRQPGSEFGKPSLRSFRRSSSFNESVDKYNRLLDTSSDRDSQEGKSRKNLLTSREDNGFSSLPKRLPATLQRNLSLPTLRPSFSMRNPESAPDTNASRNTFDGSFDATEHNSLCVGLEDKLEPSSFSESEIQQEVPDFGKTSYDLVNSMAWESPLPKASNVEHHPVSRNDLNYQEGESCRDPTVLASKDLKEDSLAIQEEEEDDTVDIDAMESKVKQYYGDQLRIQVDAKNEAEFNYVKEVLELSGFSRDEILGKWYSEEYPVDPTVFDEVAGCLVDWSGNEEGEIRDHMLLFDLINEVLLSIYERSCCYWPMPLTSLSLVRQTPKGQRVLEEVWSEINWLLCSRLHVYESVEDLVGRDMAKWDGWMNLQFDTECVGLEFEDLILDDLLEEIVST
ncbi:protein TRM32 [Andrographis paniculata]|uniref:protein TRM32 n=1 Tax=Andrographis paniculata TaxID=175694 RepID=UPI0021E8607B|nr:protein TRM32 [Andrographis paniculata]XP_051114039.1 protein TRM32 [Andrographis paniculata]XP_051114040.1 protein TRM32 [Andrographis paniculata]XP_051114041.1 protein TRM32 [Andrographis paniculata]XP_051114042.1 protein TRM32 [Andrographis paniculata]